ncbi:hypothetical protein ACX93W_12560 [Paenibacillus sp. CAU 1782]
MGAFDFDTHDFTKGLETLEQRITEGAARGLYDFTQMVHDASRQLAPNDKGTLRRESWTEYSETPTTLSSEIHFSVSEKDANGKAFDYALKLHEMGEYKNPTTPGTQPKFLERPLKENAHKLTEYVAAEIRKGL